jgi:hypothetical protein
VSTRAVADHKQQRPLRGTQLFVEHISSVIRRPSLIAIEVAWRWLFGIPLLYVLRGWAASILSKAQLSAIDAANPWHAASQLAEVWDVCQPLVQDLLGRLLLPGAVAWIVVSGLGRSFVLMRLDPRLRLRPLSVMLLQAAWLCLFALTVWAWYRSMSWVGATHITVAGEPDLIGYAIWTIFLALGFFTAWALMSWTVTIAPLLALLEDRSALSALVQSLKLGKPFTGKLAEINLVLGIVKLALLVLAIVFSAAPLPFSDELGPAALHFTWAASAVFYLVADDFFQVVRLKAFLEFWKIYRRA